MQIAIAIIILAQIWNKYISTLYYLDSFIFNKICICTVKLKYYTITDVMRFLDGTSMELKKDDSCKIQKSSFKILCLNSLFYLVLDKEFILRKILLFFSIL